MARGKRNPLHLRLARRLRQARKRTGLSLERLAAQAGLTAGAIGHIEGAGRIPRLSTVESLAAALGLRAGWLAYGLGEEAVPHTADVRGSVGVRIQALRAYRGLTRVALAEASELTGTSILHVEAGRSDPRVDSIERIAKALRASPSWLAFGDGEGPTIDATIRPRLDRHLGKLP